MTWGGFLSRSLSLIIVLPLVLTRLTTAEIALWYLFSTIISLQSLVDMGFSPTFTRVIAYARGGVEAEDLDDLRKRKLLTIKAETNWETIERICSTMRVVYIRLTLISVPCLILLGSWSLTKPISATETPIIAWTAWGTILCVSTVSLLGNLYASYLRGLNQVALLGRWEIITSLGAIFTSFLVLLFNGGLLGLVLANQSWRVLNILRNRFLCRYLFEKRFKAFRWNNTDTHIMSAVWPSAWRSGLGALMSYGLVQLSGVMYAQFGSVSNVASYLLGLRFIQLISSFSQAPFYSKLPMLTTLRAQGEIQKLVYMAQRGMKLSYLSYALGFVGLGLFSKPLLQLIGSNADFPNSVLWSLMGLAVFIERYGAMHIQLYSITNHIIWHIANGISGSIYLILSLILFKYVEVYAFPIALLISYLSFYAWYCASYSYREYDLKFWIFERKTLLIPFAVMLSYSVCAFFPIFTLVKGL
ncbi:MAG: hypothetical protein ACFB2W_05850 [Leptolyngbyaceae cyanobacterium]